jgi:hypothetical protein
MERSAIRECCISSAPVIPDFAALHPGYLLRRLLMSMEIYVLSDKRLSSMATWQKAVENDGFALRLDIDRPLGQLQGHLPATWRGQPAGFECDHWKPDDVLAGYPKARFDHRWAYCLAFRWGANARACLGAYMAASSYAKATSGVVFDCDAAKILTPQQAKQTATQIEKDLPSFERTMQSFMARVEQTGRLP